MQKMKLYLLLSSLLLSSGCASISYYSQAVSGHLSLLMAAESSNQLLQNPNTDERLRTQLKKAKDILSFAESYGLPVAESYSTYVDTKRAFVVWNVFAADPTSTTRVSHCFPIAGCVGYRGFFAKVDAESYAEELNASGLDVYVGGVAAYSTLGWFDDPLLNTFIYREDTRLAAILFHELAHKVLYVPGDTVFNESFATAVERALLEKWLTEKGMAQHYEAYLASADRRQQVIQLVLKTKSDLGDLYGRDLDKNDMLELKRLAIAALRKQYRQLQASWQTGDEFSHWIEQDLNNAHLAAIGAYQGYVSGFNFLLAESDDLEKFFEKSRALSEMSLSERADALASPAL